MSIKFKKILTIGIQLKARKNFKQKYEYQRISNFLQISCIIVFFVGRIASPPKLIFLIFPMKAVTKGCTWFRFFSYFHTISLQALSIYRLTLTKKRLFRQIIMSHIYGITSRGKPLFFVSTLSWCLQFSSQNLTMLETSLFCERKMATLRIIWSSA